MRISKRQLRMIIKEELRIVLNESFTGLKSSDRHVFKKLKSGNWGKVYRPEGESHEGDLVIKPNTRGFPYDDFDEQQDFLENMPQD